MARVEQRLELPELCFKGRLGIASQLRKILDNVQVHAPPEALCVRYESV